MGWLDNAIRRRMPVSLGVDQLRDALRDVPDEVEHAREDVTLPRTAE